MKPRRNNHSSQYVVSRRTALRAGVAGLVGVGCASAWAQSAKDNPYAPLKVGVHSFSLREFSLPDAVRIAKELGVKYMSLNPKHLALDSTPEQRAEAKRLLAEAGITLMGVGVVGFKADEAAARKTFAFARDMNLRVIAGNPDPDSLGLLDKLVEEFNIPVGIHNHGPESLYSVPEDLLKVFRNHHKLIGACVDVGHFVRAGIKAEDAIDALGERMYDVHIKDVDKAEKDGGPVVMGTGVVNLKAVVKRLLDRKFEGHVAFEYEADAKNPQPGMAKSLEYLRGLIPARG